ncbi:MAG TPA: hypothetical protein VIU33_05035, partial [Nitrospiria bacterium]
VFKTAVLPTGTIGVINLVPKDHTAFAGGVEYTFFNLFGNNDLGLILEYLYNSEQDLDALAFRPFQNDLFGGFRLVRNNPGDGELLTGVFYDLNIGSQILRVEYSERFFEKVGVEVAVDLLNADTEDQLFVFNNEDRFTLVLTYTY